MGVKSGSMTAEHESKHENVYYPRLRREPEVRARRSKFEISFLNSLFFTNDTNQALSFSSALAANPLMDVLGFNPFSILLSSSAAILGAFGNRFIRTLKPNDGSEPTARDRSVVYDTAFSTVSNFFLKATNHTVGYQAQSNRIADLKE